MARLSRAEIFDPSEIVPVHVVARTNRRCFLMGDDQYTGKNFDHRKRWIEDKLKLLAANFGIDLLAFFVSLQPLPSRASVKTRRCKNLG